MIKHNKYYWDLDRNKPYKDSTSVDTEFKTVYVGDKQENLDADNYLEEQIELISKKEKKKTEINIIISCMRLLGYGLIPFSLVLATSMLILSEFVSWILVFDD